MSLGEVTTTQTGGTASGLWTDVQTWAPVITYTDPVQVTPPDPEAIKRADAKEAREAVERQRKDESDRQERAADATRALYSELIQGGRFVAEKALDRGPDLIRATALLVVAVGAALVPVALTIEAVLR